MEILALWIMSSPTAASEYRTQETKSCVLKRSSPSTCTTCAWPVQSRWSERRTEQVCTGCQYRLRTSTGCSSTEVIAFSQIMAGNLAKTFSSAIEKVSRFGHDHARKFNRRWTPIHTDQRGKGSEKTGAKEWHSRQTVSFTKAEKSWILPNQRHLSPFDSGDEDSSSSICLRLSPLRYGSASLRLRFISLLPASLLPSLISWRFG